MKKKSLLILLTVLATVSISMFLRFKERYVDITSQPTRAFSDDGNEVPESFISTELSFKLSQVESVVNDLFKEPFSDEGKGEYKEKFQWKTKNLLYDPNEWIKTRNPFYNPNKWIKVLGIKTKNPFYDPRKWIKTKNPMFNPNKWVYGDLIDIQIGYRYQYQIAKREPISLEPIDGDTLRMTVPLSVDGNVGFRGDLAKIGQIAKKNINAKVNVRIDLGLQIETDWCPKVNAKIDIQWVSGPAIEIASKVWLDLKAPALLMTPEFEKKVETAIEGSLVCGDIQEPIAQFLKPSSIPLSGPIQNMFLNIDPLKVSSSGLLFDEEYLRIRIASTLKLEISDTQNEESDDFSLPKLTIEETSPNIVRLGLPLSVKYSDLESVLNDQLGAINESISKLMETPPPAVAVFEGEDFEITNFELYPSGETVTLGLEFGFKTKKSLFSTKGRVFLSARPVISEEGLFHLSDIDLATKLDNSLYPLILAVLKEGVITMIQDQTQIDLAPRIEYGKTQLMERVMHQLSQVNGLELSIAEINVDLSERFGIHEKYISKTILINSGFEAEIRVKELAMNK